MLKSFHVKDYALIESIEIEFGGGLNIITGETGAGKSILVDAMGLLLGERASTEAVRKGASKSVVEGVFEIDGNEKVKQILEQNEIENFSDLLIRREISLKGANRCFVNDTPLPLTVVKEIGDLLVDLHGQHEHQSLLKVDTHIDFLDEFGGVNELLREYKEIYNKLLKFLEELNELEQKEGSLKERRELYLFQIKEIDAVGPERGEENKLHEELNILENSEKLLELTSRVYDQLYESDNSINDSLVNVKNDLEKLLGIDKSFTEALSEIDTIFTLLNDISSLVRSYGSGIDLDPKHLEDIRARLGILNLLKKKYGGTLEKLIDHRKKIGEEVERTDNFVAKIEILKNEIEVIRKNAGAAAKKLSDKRKEIAGKVKKEVEEVLNELGIPDAWFDIVINHNEAGDKADNYIITDSKKLKYNSKGIDEVEFNISTNAGEDAKPLVKVASGGEISRVMLALKTVLAKNDKLPVLIFDEIDVGISGRIAQKVGTALKSLAGSHQIIAITHLPQISGLADYHYAVEKVTSDNRVVSSIKKLNDEERVKEVAKLLSGDEVTEASLKGAKELMGLN